MTSREGQNAPEQATPRQRELAAALLTCDVATAAAVVGVSLSTAKRWRRLPAVKAEISRLTDQAASDAAARAGSLMTEAADTLAAIMRDGAAPVGARVAAAGRLLEAGPRLKDAADLAARVAALEEGSA